MPALPQRIIAGAHPVGVIGQGTWGLGLSAERRAREVAALRLGITLGANLIDTAEYYGAGRTEDLVGEAIAPLRAHTFVVTKVWPSHAAPADLVASARASIQRLGVPRVGAVLLHWPTRSLPLAPTLAALADLCREGLAATWGLSNFQGAWLARAEEASPAGTPPALHELPYSLANRRIEHGPLPHARAHGQVVLAWSPLGHGHLSRWAGYPSLVELAAARAVTPPQMALAYLAHQPGVVAIPRAADPVHVHANVLAGTLSLTAAEFQRLEFAFPRGRCTRFLAPPPWNSVFRLVFWIERRWHGGPPLRPDRPPTPPAGPRRPLPSRRSPTGRR